MNNTALSGYLFSVSLDAIQLEMSSNLQPEIIHNSSHDPLITIGIATYDRVDMLKQCINLILIQPFQDVEILVGNDFVGRPISFDALGMNADARVRIINNPKRLGPNANMNYLLREARGKWFTWLADDDLMHPKFLGVAHQILVCHSVNSIYTNFSAAQDPYGVFPREFDTFAPRILSGLDFIEEYTSRRIRMIGCYGMFQRDILISLGGIKNLGSSVPFYADTLIPILAASKGSVAYVDAELFFLREHSGSNSANLDLIKTYSSAQKDFLVEFHQCCKVFMCEPDYQRQLVNMLKWFAADGWCVICRGSYGAYGRIANFYRFFKEDLMPYLPSNFKGSFRLFAIKLVMLDLARNWTSRVLRKVKSWG